MAATVLPASLERKSWLERFLSLMAEVRPGEAGTVLLLSLNGFLVLTAYYVIRPLREAFILGGLPGGAETKAYTGAAFAGLFLFIIPAYGRFASKVSRVRLINWVTLVFVSNLVIFFFVGRAGVRLGIPFFLWVGIFNLMVVAQFWSFANDVYTTDEGQRLFAIVGFACSMGAVAGSAITGRLIKPFGLFAPMLVSAAILLLCLLMTNLVHAREKGRARSAARREQAEQPLARDGGFQLVLRHRYLLLIGLMTLVVQLVNTNGEYLLGRTVSEGARSSIAAGTAGGLSTEQIVAGFYANFQFYQNSLGALVQLFVASRVLKYLGAGRALFIMPVISLFGYGMTAFLPVLAYIRVAKILENATDYSLQNLVRRALFLPTSREAKYKALQAVETFFWRGGDMFSGLSVLVGVTMLGLGVRSFAVYNLGLVLLWLLLAAGITREHGKLSAEPAAKAA